MRHPEAGGFPCPRRGDVQALRRWKALLRLPTLSQSIERLKGNGPGWRQDHFSAFPGWMFRPTMEMMGKSGCQVDGPLRRRARPAGVGARQRVRLPVSRRPVDRHSPRGQARSRRRLAGRRRIPAGPQLVAVRAGVEPSHGVRCSEGMDPGVMGTRASRSPCRRRRLRMHRIFRRWSDGRTILVCWKVPSWATGRGTRLAGGCLRH